MKEPYSSMYRPIVVVDDDPDDCQILYQGFNKIGQTDNIIFFQTGIDLISYLNTVEPCEFPLLIVLDYHLPRLKGDEIIREIRSNPFFRDIHILLYSTVITPHMKSNLVHENVLLFVEKGSNPQKLQNQVSFFAELIQDFNHYSI